MATEKRMIYANDVPELLEKEFARKWRLILDGETHLDNLAEGFFSAKSVIWAMPTVDAVPVDDIRLHHILIDNEGVPEVKLQIGDRYFILHTDPVDVREVVHGRWEDDHCTNCNTEFTVNINGEDVKITEMKSNYCPNCGAKMDGDGNA